jgi:hypothetical protein
VNLISFEQLEILMLVGGAEHPVQTALDVHRRWRYILSVALSAREGQVCDQSLPQVVQMPDEYIGRAQAILAVLEEWIMEQSGRTATEFG